MPKIMISYRRAGAKAVAGRIYDRLSNEYGDANVFMDVDHIPFGIDYRTHIKSVLVNSDVLLAVVGPGWLGATPEGHRRIDEAADPVRVEIETALAEGVRIIPLLVDDTPMPAEADLPETLKPFAFLNAAPIDSGRDFRTHMARLTASLADIRKPGGPNAAPRARAHGWRKVGMAAAGLGAIVAAAVAVYAWRPPAPGAAPPAGSGAAATLAPAATSGGTVIATPPLSVAAAGAPHPAPAGGRLFQVLSSGVSDGILNMREGPGTKHSLVVSIPAGQSGVVLSGECRMPDDGGKKPWCRAKWLRYEGWLSTCCVVDPVTGAFPKVDVAAGTLID